MSTRPLVEMRGVWKRFGDVVALAGVDVAVRSGEIHALLGENGAGKTTLVNVLAGLYRADAGEIRLEGRPVRIASPRDAVTLGIGMVHQHSELVGHASALENIVLGREGPGLLLRRAQRRVDVEALAARYGLPVDLDTPARALPVGVQQKVEILKALYRGARVLILDEPTTLLTPREVDRLFATLREVTRGGVTIIFITHKIREVLAAADRITVMRQGRVVATVAANEADAGRLVELMIGERLPDLAPDRPPGGGVPILEVQELVVPDHRGGVAVRGVSLMVRSGELVGIAGISGNGQRELAEAVVGVRPVTGGRIVLDGLEITHAPVAARLDRGLAFVPEDRLADGILPRQSLADTLLLGLHRVLFRGWRYNRRQAEALAREAIAAYRIVAPGPQIPTAALSGGNIQKVLVARALLLAERAGGRLLVALNPTRGLDVPSTRFIHDRLRHFRQRGGAVLVVSEDLDELMALCDRLMVMAAGRLTGTFSQEAYDPYRIGALMVGTAV
ncbi:MAG: ABC transporter ATP-binding protein [Armatimonadota bacterium]|nr:ABC transporter ATP-binding protein [Armatimonadota bacterium]MDR7485721.1 ABC transporter ATP-binding protein [Armatimonadota bacterium]MDR7534162.1 ABC transporter ATP-binding protein [Armatimonadota bacterium]MDR7536385.1 ABC transporter ATP-binding protein [Armatimonadota bacterium]